MTEAGTVAPRGGWYHAAELSCAGLGLGLVAASVRLFSNGSALAVLAAVVMGAWLLSALLRRTRLNGWTADAIHGATGLVLLVWVAAPQQRWGVLPSWDSVEAVAQAVREDFTRFDREVAPLVARTGHLVVMGALLWVLTLFNSTTAMRLRAPVQAAVPHLFAFVGLGFVSREPGRMLASVAMLASLGTYALAQLAWRRSLLRWIPDRRAVLGRYTAAGATIMVGVAGATALVVPLLPGGADPVLDLRRGGLGEDGPRTVVSPFVDVGSQLASRSDELMFTMTAPQPQYWRISALDTYEPDRAIWVLSNSYEPVESPLRPDAAEGAEAVLDVRGLGGIWIPAPEHPVSAEADFGLNWDEAAGSLIRREGELADRDSVSFGVPGTPDAGSEGTDPSAEDLRGGPAVQGDPDLTNAEGAPPELAALAARFAGGNPSHEALLALQDHFRTSFAYDETVELSSEPDPLSAFLELGRGFCQQFSTAFALGARSMGFESRVVVGFTSGDAVGDAGDGSSVYAVRGRHAHAWPEVRFEGIGWVPYEPTPGRGNPATTDLTGVAGAQAAPPEGEVLPEDLPTTTAPPADEPATTAASTSTPAARVEAGGEPEAPAAADTGGFRWIALVVALVATGAVAAVWLYLRAGRHPRDDDPVGSAWQGATRVLAGRGFRIEAHETPAEFATRCDAQLDVPELLELAGLEAQRRWAAERDPSAGDSAGAALEELTRRVADGARHPVGQA